jgi:hypothetical protein
MPIPHRTRTHDNGIFTQPAQARDDDLAARRSASFTCPRGHEFAIPFAENAATPGTWECRQHGTTAQLANTTPQQQSTKTHSHLDLVLERRPETELAQLLNQQLNALQAGQLISVEQWLQQTRATRDNRLAPTTAGAFYGR